MIACARIPVSRRYMLVGTTSLALSAIIPAVAVSQLIADPPPPKPPASIDTALGPITMMDGLGFAMSVIGAIAQSDANRKILRRLNQINQKLDIVLLQQQEILREIRDLRLYISKALFDQFQTETEITIRAILDRYPVYASSNFQSTPFEELNSLANSLQDQANIAGQCDFSAFQTFMLAASSSLAIRAVTGMPKEQRRHMADKFTERLLAWCSSENPRSVVRAQEECRNKVTSLRNELEIFPKEIQVSSPVWRPMDRGQECIFFNVQEIIGSFENGFQLGAVVERQGICQEQRHRDPGDGGGPGGNAPPLTFTSAGPDYGGIPTSQVERTGNLSIDSKNNLRKSVIEEMRRERDLAYLKTAIQDSASLMSVA